MSLNCGHQWAYCSPPGDIYAYRAPVDWCWQGKIEELGEKSVPVTLCPPHIIHGLTRARTQTSAVRGRWVTLEATYKRLLSIVHRWTTLATLIQFTCHILLKIFFDTILYSTNINIPSESDASWIYSTHAYHIHKSSFNTVFLLSPDLPSYLFPPHFQNKNLYVAVVVLGCDTIDVTTLTAVRTSNLTSQILHTLLTFLFVLHSSQFRHRLFDAWSCFRFKFLTISASKEWVCWPTWPPESGCHEPIFF
jgi:hypothetical protein